jgi:hypothetical protein
MEDIVHVRVMVVPFAVASTWAAQNLQFDLGFRGGGISRWAGAQIAESPHEAVGSLQGAWCSA